MERKARIILLEDNQTVRRSLTLILEHKGYEVLAYENPLVCPLHYVHECPCSAQECCADFILTDIDMPNFSGIEFIARLINTRCKIKNIGIMSGAWSSLNRKRAEDMGCKVFEKPFKTFALTEWINDCMQCVDNNHKLSDWFQPKRA